MRIADISDYWKLRKLVTNPMEVIKFRWKGKKTRGASLKIDFKFGPSLHIRGGYDDFHIFHRIFLRDEYRVKDLLRQQMDCVVDLGSNVGLFSALMAPVTRAIYAYEPCPLNFDQITANLTSRSNITVRPEAVAGEDGTLHLYLPRNELRSGSYSSFSGSALLKDNDFYEVPAISLDTLFQRHAIINCDLLKLDVEGQEYDILYATSNKTYNKIKRIHAEYHYTWTNDNTKTITALASFLKTKGFTVDVAPKKNKDSQGMFFARK